MFSLAPELVKMIYFINQFILKTKGAIMVLVL